MADPLEGNGIATESASGEVARNQAAVGMPAEPSAEPSIESPALPPRSHQATYLLFGLLLCAAIFRIGYSYLVNHGLGQGGAMFIGLPVLLGTAVAFATYPRSPLGMVLKVTAMVLCILAPLLEEGAICIVIAAPLIFGTIGLVALVLRFLNPRLGRGKVTCCAALLGLAPILWEPAEKPAGWEEMRPIDEVSDSIEVDAAPLSVWQALQTSPTNLRAAPLPTFLRLRGSAGTRLVFGHGLALGDTRDILFDADHFVGQVVHSQPGHEVVFAVRETAAAPGERIGLWLRFVQVRLVLTALSPGRTRVTQITRYRRLLDPAFYFAPIERAGVHAMHRYTLALLLFDLPTSAALHG